MLQQFGLFFLFHLLSSLPSIVAQSSTSTVSWLYPIQDHITINFIDTIVWQWTSDYSVAYFLLWCQINGPGENVQLGSKFQVQPNGSYPYVMFSQNPTQKKFPVACHALLSDEPDGRRGYDSPVGITWTSQASVAAKTFSLEQRQNEETSSRGESTGTTRGSSSQTGSASVGRSITPATSVTSTLPTSSTTSDSNSATSSGKPSTLTLGLSIGISITIFILAIVVLFFFLRRRKKARSQEASTDTAGVARAASGYGSARFGRHELEDEPRRLHEMEAREREKAELDAAHGETAGPDVKRKSGWSTKDRRKKGESVYELP